jgi:hypothetical protein
MVLAKAVEGEAQLVGQLDPFEGLGELAGDRDLLTGDRVGVAVAETVDAELHERA